MTNIDWERVQAGLDREKHKMIWRPYGLPQIMDLETSAFHDAEISQPWDIPQKMIVSVARRPAAGRGLNVSYAHLDVTDEASWHAAVDHALDRLGGTSLVDRDSGAPGVGILHFGTAGCAAACRFSNCAVSRTALTQRSHVMSTSICLTLVSNFKRQVRLQWRGEAPGVSAMEEPDGFQHCDVRILVRCRPCYLVNEAGRLSDPRMAGVSCQVGMPVTMHDAHSVQLALAAPTVTMLFGISPCPVSVQLAGFAMNLASDGLTVDSQ